MRLIIFWREVALVVQAKVVVVLAELEEWKIRKLMAFLPLHEQLSVERELEKSVEQCCHVHSPLYIFGFRFGYCIYSYFWIPFHLERKSRRCRTGLAEVVDDPVFNNLLS